MTRGVSAIAALVALVLAFGAVVVAAVLLAGGGRDDFGGGSIEDLTDAFDSYGLTVCEGGFDDSGRGDGGAISTREIALGRSGDCATTLVVQIDAYDDAAHRDAAARAAESRQRPRAFGTVFTWRQYTVYLQADEASGAADIRDGIVDALDSVGAR
jgi:hypothetical protein